MGRDDEEADDVYTVLYDGWEMAAVAVVVELQLDSASIGRAVTVGGRSARHHRRTFFMLLLVLCC